MVVVRWINRITDYHCLSVTGHSITLNDTLEYEKSFDELTPDVGASRCLASSPDESRILTFSEIKALIEQGKIDQIPNNEHIPDAINVCGRELLLANLH